VKRSARSLHMWRGTMRVFRLFPFAAALLFAMSHATEALAEDPPVVAPAPAATQWYGWQTLAVDAGAIGLMTLGGLTQGGCCQGGSILSAGVGVYAFGAPAVHLFHDQPGTAFADLALRLGAPLAVGMFGYGIGTATFHDGLAGLAVGAVGVLAGSLTAVALDAAWLAREPAPRENTASAVPVLRWSPQVGVTARGGASAGVTGSF
jgi:hypothetical protein